MKLRRKELRKMCTREELILWNLIKGKQLGLKFFRQYSIGNYVIDFYCPVKRLAIEIDGSQHNDAGAKKYDIYRTEYLKAFGIRVVRFWNSEVMKNVNNVVKVISGELNDIY